MSWIEPGASLENRVQRAGYSPNGKHIYGLNWGTGLIVSDAATGKELADFKGIGAFGNAETLGATFDPTGRVAAIANPYGEFVTLIDMSTLKVIQQFKISSRSIIAGLRLVSTAMPRVVLRSPMKSSTFQRSR